MKTDRGDAVEIARLLRSGDLTRAHVPGVEDEAVRDVCQARDAARVTLKAARLRVKPFLLRLGLHCTGRATWNDAHPRHHLLVARALAWDMASARAAGPGALLPSTRLEEPH